MSDRKGQQDMQRKSEVLERYECALDENQGYLRSNKELRKRNAQLEIDVVEKSSGNEIELR